MRFTFGGEQRVTSQPPSETHDIASTSATALSGQAIPVSEVNESSGPTSQTSKPHPVSHAPTNAVSADALGATNLEPDEPRFPVASGRVSLANMVFSESASGEAEESCGSLYVVSEGGAPQGGLEIDGRETMSAAAEQNSRTWKPSSKMAGVTEIESLTEDASRILAQVMSTQDSTAATALGGERTRGRGIRSPPRGDDRNVPTMSTEFAVLDESDVTNFHQMIPELALNFPFELDTFQKRAVMCLERREDVFVAAHTSAGKTVVAEYAVALAAQSAGRVCYTSPIKSLSNQKFRDFSKKFECVGIVTGDVSIRQESQCLIMTTEILRSMLYRSDDMLRCVDWVVFDETQYLNDPERGVVWETCILMLPPHVRMIMLSATVPNALEFAAWVGRTKQRRVSVVMTNDRPVPLEHALLHVDSTPSAMQTNVQGDRPLITTVLLRQGGRFLHENFAAAVRDTSSDERGSLRSTDGTPTSPRSTRFALGNGDKRCTRDGATSGRGQDTAQPRGRGSGRASSGMDGMTRASGMANGPEATGTLGDRGRRDRGGRGARGRGGRGGYGRGFGEGRGGGSNWKSSAGHGTLSWIPAVRYLERQLLTPAIIFCFSKRKCAKAVDSLAFVDLLTDAKDKARAHRIFENAMLKLQEADRNLPQVLAVREHLKKGIAAHHAGLLPIIKEVTEILFSEGLIKVLFATETFAMGVNFPAKSVVFVGYHAHLRACVFLILST
jgi:superfamily II RNA helicase